MNNELIPVSDIERMASAVANSGLFGMKSVEQAMALMLLAQAEGLHPATAARDYHVIQGRPALKADAMMARFLSAGGRVQWGEYNDQRVAGTFSHPHGGSVEIVWTFEQAKKIGLAGKDTWKHYPRAMLRARVISEGIRTVYPGVAVGIYTDEETHDFINVPTRDMGTDEVVSLKVAPIPTELASAATAAASNGIEDYAAFWAGITKEERLLLKALHEDLKAVAARIDAEAP